MNAIVEYLEIRYPFQLCVLGALRECIDETNTYQLQCFSSMKIVGAPVKIFTLALLKFLF